MGCCQITIDKSCIFVIIINVSKCLDKKGLLTILRSSGVTQRLLSVKLPFTIITVIKIAKNYLLASGWFFDCVVYESCYTLYHITYFQINIDILYFTTFIEKGKSLYN